MSPAERYADILVVDLLGGIGDLLMILPAVHGLARRNPGARLRVLTDEPGADLVRGDPAVTEVHAPAPGEPARAAVRRVLAAGPPDLAVTTARHDGIPALLADSGARCVTDLWRRPPPDELVSTRYLRILQAEGLLDAGDLDRTARVRLSHRERAAGERLLAGHLPPSGPPPVVLVPDAGMAVKRWPDACWSRLTGILRGRGHPVLAAVPGAGATRTAVPPGAVALAAGDLRQLAAVFAAAAGRGGVVVGGDTGPVRLAAAAGARTVALFGPTLATRYGLGEGSDLQGLPHCPHRRPTSITEQVCWWHARCPLSPTGPACMADIPVEDVAAAVRSELDRSGS
jgi:ADP-heptose:LPS heptosyltransferase